MRFVGLSNPIQDEDTGDREQELEFLSLNICIDINIGLILSRMSSLDYDSQHGEQSDNLHTWTIFRPNYDFYGSFKRSSVTYHTLY